MIDPTIPAPQSVLPDSLALPLGEWQYLKGHSSPQSVTIMAPVWRASLNGIYQDAETQAWYCAYTILSGDIGNHRWLRKVTWWRENMTYAPTDPIGEM